MKNYSRYWIKKLNLSPHPEGGFFRETYRSNTSVKTAAGERAHSTAIYFLLEKENFSAFHRIKSDELWHFYAGDPLTIYVLQHEVGLIEIKLGSDLDKGQQPQAVVPANSWFASKVTDGGNFSLVGCTVAPGFDFADFEMAHRFDLVREFPTFSGLIETLTR